MTTAQCWLTGAYEQPKERLEASTGVVKASKACGTEAVADGGGSSVTAGQQDQQDDSRQQHLQPAPVADSALGAAACRLAAGQSTRHGGTMPQSISSTGKQHCRQLHPKCPGSNAECHPALPATAASQRLGLSCNELLAHCGLPQHVVLHEHCTTSCRTAGAGCSVQVVKQPHGSASAACCNALLTVASDGVCTPGMTC
jgi:hypothetical protein